MNRTLSISGLQDRIAPLLVCPITHQPLSYLGHQLSTPDAKISYAITPTGIPQFSPHAITQEGEQQSRHYDAVANSYLENLALPHTQEYMRYLDEKLLAAIGKPIPAVIVELCCGRGEAFILLKDKITHGIGVDVSLSMLENAREISPNPQIMFMQADATMLPLADNCCELVMLMGGIHHVNDRIRLFAEINRVLKPGGRLVFREPVSDFFLWRLIRFFIYRISPALDHKTEAPLRYRSTLAQLRETGFDLVSWETYGAVGFCLFMNSDILIFNRLFRFIPKIQTLTRLAARFDSIVTSIPGFRHGGLQVVGCARKP